MNANDLTFGVEIETIAPDSAVRNDGLRIGAYKRGVQVPYLPTGWKAEPGPTLGGAERQPALLRRDRRRVLLRQPARRTAEAGDLDQGPLRRRVDLQRRRPLSPSLCDREVSDTLFDDHRGGNHSARGPQPGPSAVPAGSDQHHKSRQHLRDP